MDLRNLEQIQEQDRGARPLPFGALVLAAIAGGALVVAVMTTLRRDAEPAQIQKDPLAELLAQQSAAPPAASVDDSDVTFPELLSDTTRPTTALAAVKDERGRLLRAEEEEDAPVQLSPVDSTAKLELPGAQLPAGDLLHSTKVTTDPQDDLSQMAARRLAGESDEMAPLGQQGGYEIQVASFGDPADADRFVDELRKRGHRAYRQAAYVPGRGLWHRVRVGSFKTKYEAHLYQKKLEQSERISTFLVDPEKVKRQEAVKEAKREARERKDERRRKRQAAADDAN